MTTYQHSLDTIKTYAVFIKLTHLDRHIEDLQEDVLTIAGFSQSTIRDMKYKFNCLNGIGLLGTQDYNEMLDTCNQIISNLLSTANYLQNSECPETYEYISPIIWDAKDFRDKLKSVKSDKQLADLDVKHVWNELTMRGINPSILKKDKKS